MIEFDKIYLSWKAGAGSGRHIVGLIEKHGDNVQFSYYKEEVEKARENGFVPYTEFSDVDVVYSDNVLEIFSQRLIKSERSDVQKFYDFWEIEPQYFNDKFYLLGHTQGLLPTDNFEFLADYNPVENLHFLTDIASLSVQRLGSETVGIDDDLQMRFEEKNEYDKDAVAVYKGELKVGYIKKIHCKVFHKLNGTKLKLKVKAVDKNGVVKRAFVKVFF